MERLNDDVESERGKLKHLKPWVKDILRPALEIHIKVRTDWDRYCAKSATEDAVVDNTNDACYLKAILAEMDGDSHE